MFISMFASEPCRRCCRAKQIEDLRGLHPRVHQVCPPRRKMWRSHLGLVQDARLRHHSGLSDLNINIGAHVLKLSELIVEVAFQSFSLSAENVRPNNPE